LRAELACAQARLALGDWAQAAGAFAHCLGRARELRILPPEVRALTGQGLVASTWGSDRLRAALSKPPPRSSRTSAAPSAATSFAMLC
jgi:hypothetical protein